MKAGLTHSEGARSAHRARRQPQFRPILADVRQRVREGALLSEALSAQGSFPPVYVTVVASGERSGNLTGVLDQYISYLRVSTGFRSALITSLIYPSVLIVATYWSSRTWSPTPCRNLPACTKNWKSLFLLPHAFCCRSPCLCATTSSFSSRLSVVGAIGIFLWTRSDRGALAIDRLKPRLPFFGQIWLKAQVAQFVRTLSTLLAGGTPWLPPCTHRRPPSPAA